MALTVGEVMTREVETIEPDRTLTEMDRLLVARGISGVPVVEGDRIVGIVSQTDVIRILYGEQQEARKVSAFFDSPFPIPLASLAHLARDRRRIADHMTKLRVRDVMTPAPARVAPDASVEEVARLMSREGFHRVPVVEGERLVGIVSTMDFVRLLGEGGFAAR